jgi:hypothetical protein
VGPFFMGFCMRIDVLCKVIDNFGDAGFCLRLARALLTKGHAVRLIHDNSKVFEALLADECMMGLGLFDASSPSFDLSTLPCPDLIVEPFGSSSEQTTLRFDVQFKVTFPEVPWLVVDYLSAEDWVEGFHCSRSVNPATGHVCTYFYPGFTAKTGGVIHCDVDRTFVPPPKACCQKVFVFAYPQAPLDVLLDGLGESVAVGLASAHACQDNARVTVLPFVPQAYFDAALLEHDVLFVRGEDSFVRAQLLGKPFVWQVYPTPDGYHAVKLEHFLNRYLAGCSAALRSTMRTIWFAWNGLAPSDLLPKAWADFQNHWVEINEHALKWRKQLLDGPELVGEILAWKTKV